jgi:hypothetical protein
MPRGGPGTAGPGKRIGRPPKALESITQTDIVTALRAPKGIDKLFDLRLRKFGLTRIQYGMMLAEQKGRCAVCNEPLSSGWVIDHCHLTMKVRGLLHSKCNTLLGLVNEDPKRLELAIAYLNRHNKFLV